MPRLTYKNILSFKEADHILLVVKFLLIGIVLHFTLIPAALQGRANYVSFYSQRVHAHI